VPIVNQILIYSILDDEYSDIAAHAAVLDQNDHIHVFFVVEEFLANYLYYMMIDLEGNILIPSFALENPNDVDLVGSVPDAVVSEDGSVWAAFSEGYVGVTETGEQIDIVRNLNPDVDVIRPYLAIGPDSTVWSCFRWNIDFRVVVRRIDVPDSPAIEVSRGADQNGIFIDSLGNKFFVLYNGQLGYCLKITPTEERDSVVFFSDFFMNIGTTLTPAGDDSLVFLHDISYGGTYEFSVVWISHDCEILRGPETYARNGFALDNSGFIAGERGAYWNLGIMGTSPNFQNELCMIHVPGLGEPLEIESAPSASQQFSTVTTFPSPNAGYFFLRLPNDIGAIHSILVFNTLGQLVWETDALWPASSDASIEFPVGISNGVYFLSIRSALATTVSKVVLVR